MPEEIQTIEAPFMEAIKSNAGFTIIVGVVLLLMGLLAMGSPLVAGLSLAMMVGVLLIIGGIGQLIFAFKAGKQVFTIVVGILTTVIGVYMVISPDVALATLTIFLSAYLIISGIFEVLMSFQIKPVKGWGWAMFSGVASVLLGFMIWSQFPLSGAWAIGILIGVKLFLSGLTLLMFGLAARGVASELAGAVE
jgi:uncharacterized membrane protein HdeD (DUF308 family)